MSLRRILCIVAIIFIVLMGLPSLITAESADDRMRKLLTEGDKFLIQGRSSYPKAIEKYSEALAINGKDPKALFRRAELYSMMKESEKCHTDLSLLLTVDGSHKQGLQLRAKLAAAKGDLLLASEDYKRLVEIHSKDEKKAQKFMDLAQRTHDFGSEWDKVRQALQTPNLSRNEKKPLCQRAVRVLKPIVADFAKDIVSLRMQRAECAMLLDDSTTVSDELKYILKRDPNNLEAIVLSARTFRSLGAIDQAKSETRRCLTLDPEYGPCADFHKLMKKYGKQTQVVERMVEQGSWGAVQKEIDAALALDENPPNLVQLWQWKCQGFTETRQAEQAISACTTVIDLVGVESPPAWPEFLARMDAHILNDDLAKAEEDFNAAKELGEKSDNNFQNNQKFQRFRQKLDRLKKAAARKNYYKILGVKKTADASEIRRTYRKLAMEVHPDKLMSKTMSVEERQAAEDRFREINEAKEVLLDADLRRRYDNGEDVMDKSGGGHQHHHQHFHHGGFQNGGFEFRYG